MSHFIKVSRLTRRAFLKRAVGVGILVGAGDLITYKKARAAAILGPIPALPAKKGWAGPMGVERIARMTPQGYTSPTAANDDIGGWLQVDLGESRAVDVIKLFPMMDMGGWCQNFPSRFRLELSDEPQFESSRLVVDCTSSDYPDPADAVSIFPVTGGSGRYLRLTVTRTSGSRFQLSKLEVWSGNTDIAQGCPIMDSFRGNLGREPLTRAPRGQGEGVVTNNPANVIPASEWKRVPYVAHAPISGVSLGDGVFLTAMQNNIGYLLSSFSVDQLLRPFRDRAGMSNPSGLPDPIPFWDTDLPGSNAGRFLMGAGNTVRWIDHPELRSRMNAVVAGIAECARPDGFAMAYPDDSMFYSERGAYTRSWVTHGLIEAGYAGNDDAFRVLRAYYDWFDQCEYLPELLRRGGQGVQGQVANTRMYFTPVGKPEDIQVVQRYYQENYWMDQLAERDPDAIWKYQYDHPHNYLLTSLEPYLDQYTATGAKKYLDAAMGGWELYYNNWVHVGGSLAICEGDWYPPKTYFLHKHTGELCGSVFWVRYNQRFHQLSPDEEKYVTEIEKSIYNVGLANQVGDSSIRYHANLEGNKDPGSSHNTCCEGQGTRLIGSLPEYIYSLADNGIYVNLYHASAIEWKQSGQKVKLTMSTTFPFQPDVTLTVETDRPISTAVHLRTPSWSSHSMEILINGLPAATGKAGTYVTIERKWNSGDTITFTLASELTMTRYVGVEAVYGQDRFAMQYGPVLLALVGSGEHRIAVNRDDLLANLTRVPGQPLQYAVTGQPDIAFVPYWTVMEKNFTCYPLVGLAAPPNIEPDLAGNVALASLGATAGSDSEYDHELGCTSRIIDSDLAPAGQETHRWHSSLDLPHPHWIEVRLPKPTLIGSVVVRFADPQGHPMDFVATADVDGRNKELYSERNFTDCFHCRRTFSPVVTDRFRMTILGSANPVFANAAQISRIELYPPSARNSG